MIQFTATEQTSKKKKILLPYARGRKNRLLRADRATSRLERRRSANESRQKGRRLCAHGTKAWITNGGRGGCGDRVREHGADKGEKGITALVVERGTRDLKSARGKEARHQPQQPAANWSSTIALCRRQSHRQ